MKRLLRNVAFAAATTISVAPILTITSCTFVDPVEPEEARLDKIDLSIPDDSISVQQGTTQQADKPIEVNCFDQFGNKFSAETDLVLKTGDDLAPPSWIWIDENLKINVEGQEQPSQYDFHLYAQDKNGKVKSKVKSFCVEVFEPQPVAPDSIEVVCEKKSWVVCTTATGDIQFTINAYKEDVPEELIIKDCEWNIINSTGPRSKDLDGNDLFTITPNDQGGLLTVSSRVDTTYCNLMFNLTVEARSLADLSVKAQKDITIMWVDGFYYNDTSNKITYTRSSLNEGWTVSLLGSSVITLDNIFKSIWDSPVDSIAKNLCANSGITTLSTCILPPNIKSIGEGAFANQTYLYSLAMPGVEYVGKSAFEGCINVSLLKTYDQPSLQVIKARAFYGCSNLSFDEDTVHQINEIGDQAFRDTAISIIKLGGCVQTIGDNVFYNCPKLKYIDINCTNPPQLDGALYGGSTDIVAIRVPLKGVENYKNSAIWSIYSEKIVGI